MRRISHRVLVPALVLVCLAGLSHPVSAAASNGEPTVASWLAERTGSATAGACSTPSQPAYYDERSLLVDEAEVGKLLGVAPDAVVNRVGQGRWLEVRPSQATLNKFGKSAGKMADSLVKNAGFTSIEKNWLFLPAPHIFWSVTPPTPASSPPPAPSDPTVGGGVHIALLDTGSPVNGQAGMPTGVQLMTAPNATSASSPVPGHIVGVSEVAKRLAPGATIHAYDLTLDTGFLTEAAVIDWLYTHDYPVINLSAGMYSCSFPTALYEAVKFATQANGEVKSILVAAAGNDSTAAASYPAAFGGDPVLGRSVVGVGATLGAFYQAAPQTALASFSNTGNNMTARAPGDQIVVNYPDVGGGLRPVYVSGTSFAAPYGAGIVACLLAQGVSPGSIAPSLAAQSTLGLSSRLSAADSCTRL